MNRLGIFFFYDGSGIVDQYVETMLEDITKNFTRLITVVNGRLDTENRAKLNVFGEVIERSNEGFDVWAYKTGLESVGWDELAEYDEVVLFNNTIMGPVYPFSEMFDDMATRKVDFWGATVFPELESGDFTGVIKYGYIPEHIQSHFIVVGKRMLNSKEFHEYWDNMPPITSYFDAIGYHEAIFTKHFSDLGYSYSIYADSEELRAFNEYPIMMCPVKVLKETRLPFFKKRSFFNAPDQFLKNTMGEQTSELYSFLDKKTDYDVNLIWPPVLRMTNQADLQQNLNLTYPLSTRHSASTYVEEKIHQLNLKVGLFMHLYFEDLFEDSFEKASTMPKYADVYITTNSQDKKEKIEQIFSKLSVRSVEVRLVENRGRDVSALLVGFKDVIPSYDIACYVHDKKAIQSTPATIGDSFGFKCFESTLASEEYVVNVLEKFIENKFLGMLVPPEPNHATYYPALGHEWSVNYNNTKELADTLGLEVIMDPEKQPLAPYGSTFWFRPIALKKLFDKDWQYKDFPEEPLPVDGTISHAIERVHSFVAQDAGFFTAVAMSDDLIAAEYNNLHFYLRAFNKVNGSFGLGPTFAEMLYGLSGMLHEKKDVKNIVKRVLRKTLPNRVYVHGIRTYKKMKQGRRK
ncbi:MAG: rhamnan synthesis F family protein [Lactobacillaceae bacterium]|jgi:rhamnosyltransferase|nr:rhamnan synthesis F family protein [Lactobacillaceae bacterium]